MRIVEKIDPRSVDRAGRVEVNILDYDAWVLARLIADLPVTDAELAAVSGRWRALAERLAAAPAADRLAILEGFRLSLADPDALVQALASVKPTDPAPAATPKRLTAHLGDLAGFQSAGRFVWPSWIVRGHFNLLSSDPKIGKTHLALDLAWRIYFGLAWPDNQPATFSAGTKTLWVCGDRHQDELRERAAAFGLPPEALLLNASPDEPYGGWDLDNPDNVDALRERVEAERPALTIIDTVWRATRRRLSREDEVNMLMDPLITMAQDHDTAILGLMHLSKDAETLGRRLEGLARAILKLFKPDPGQPDRRKLIVTGNFKEPPALGVTVRDGGCDFDFTPPEEPAKSPGGRPPEEREKARKFIVEALTAQNDRKATELLREWEKSGGSEPTFWRALRDMKNDGDLNTEGGKGTNKPMIFRLILQNPPPP
jgi:AAA domain